MATTSRRRRAGGLVSFIGGWVSCMLSAVLLAVTVADAAEAGGRLDSSLGTSGALDGTFGHGGTVLTDAGGDDKAQALAIQADGKLVVAGWSSVADSSDFALARYLP